MVPSSINGSNGSAGKSLSHLTPSVRTGTGAPRGPDLKCYLDRFLDGFSADDHVAMDPVQFVRRYSDPADREVAGFVAAAFAYGNVRGVRRTVAGILDRMGPTPAGFLATFHPNRHTARFEGLVHRWNSPRDIAVLLWILRRILEDHSSIENLVLEGMGGDDTVIERGLENISNAALNTDYRKFYSRDDLATRRGVRYFFPRPSDGSACKRLNLFIRWMVREDDGVDCGVWQRIRPAQLIVPLDTHIARIGSYIGLTRYSSPGWRMAVDITRSLRELDPSDPLKYEFALCHLGIAGDCPRKQDVVKCAQCPIQAVCRL